MIDLLKDKIFSFGDLLEIMKKLRAPGGCPWDIEQTHSSIKPNMLEEAYELIEAIDLDDNAMMAEELGDVLLQVVFHACMAEEAGRFSINDVISGICFKLIERHPHIFGDVKVSGSEEVLRNWESIKGRSKGQQTKTDSLKAVSSALPALMKAEKLISRAEKAGYCFSEAELGQNDDIGLALFAQVAAARRSGVSAELALLGACAGFIESFERWERSVISG